MTAPTPFTRIAAPPMVRVLDGSNHRQIERVNGELQCQMDLQCRVQS